MTAAMTLSYTAPSSALAYMLRALAPKRAEPTGFPDLQLVWRGYRLESSLLQALRAGLPAAPMPTDRVLTLAAPQITGFRLAMATLTQPSWPLAIWGALQIRNRLCLLEEIDLDAPGTLSTHVGAWRVVEKGLEVDLCTQFAQDGRPRWECAVTFYYRGRFGGMTSKGDSPGASREAPQPTEAETVDAWRIDSESRDRFCRWTGDYNGIHRWDWYARLFGFRQAFAHPQSAALQCLARLATAGTIDRLDLWIKGPVPYGSQVELRRLAMSESGKQAFWLHVDGDLRPALTGRTGPR